MKLLSFHLLACQCWLRASSASSSLVCQRCTLVGWIQITLQISSMQHLNYCCGALRWPTVACSCGCSRLWPFFASRWDQIQTGLRQSSAPLLSLGRCSCRFCAHCLRVRPGPLPFSLKSIAFVICFDHCCGKAWNVFLMSLYAHRHERAEHFRKGETLNLSWLRDPCGSHPTRGILWFCGLVRVKVALSRTNWCSALGD